MSGLDLIPDEETALKVGITILERYYGKELIDHYRPYRVIILGDEWAVLGTGPDYHDGQRGGGFPELSISRRDGKVSRIALSR